MKWNADLYDREHGFVAEHGRDLLAYVPKKPGLRLLDVGCGTGTLAAKLVDQGLRVVGIDGSPDMIERASKRYPDIDFRIDDALEMDFENRFDIVFSNAVFHWIPDHPELLRRIHRALVPSGKLVCEFGAVGNIARIQSAFERAVEARGHAYRSPFSFPRSEEFARMLNEAGFVVELIEVYDRMTPLLGSEDGLRTWMEQFFVSDLAKLPDGERAAVETEVEDELRPVLWEDDHWVADYRRLRVVATALQ